MGYVYYGVVGHLASYWDSSLGITVPARDTEPYTVVVNWTGSAFNLEDAKAYWADHADNDRILAGQYGSTIVNISPHDLACSAEEWAEASSTPSLWFNWTKLRCNTMTRFFSVLKFSQDVVSDFANWFLDYVSVFFPFNIISYVETSWLDSGTVITLPSGLSYFDILNSNGDISLSFPTDWGGSDDPFVIFGNTPINSVPALARFFAAFRSASTYVLYAAFIWGIYKFAIYFRNKL